MNPENLAIIYLTDGRGPMYRAAAFVFETLDGIGWVEPNYTDPYGTSRPADHYTAGKVVPLPGGEGFTVQDGARTNATVTPWSVDGPDDSSGSCGRSLAYFTDYLAAKSTTIDDERARITAHLGLNAQSRS